MQIKKAEFLKSSPTLKECPPPDLPEYAFIGRSNVGKSSLINMLAGRAGLAKTSSTPGKTRLINHFSIDGLWYLVDLPGYGYARVSKRERETFSKTILEYVAKRENLHCLFVLIDGRLEPQNIDLQFVDWAGELGVPLAFIFTKSDKISQADLHKNQKRFCERLLERWESLPPQFSSSSVKNRGRDELLEFIANSMANRTK